MSEHYAIPKIDPKEYPFFSSIKKQLNVFETDVKEKRFSKVVSDYPRCIRDCNKLKKIAIKKHDEYCANITFLVKMNFTLLKNIAEFWKSCEELEYNKAWSFLQNALDENRILLKFFDEEYHKSTFECYTYLSVIEKLFPYQIFLSSAHEMEVICSICKKSPFDPSCNHITGKLYWGNMAYNIVTQMTKANHVAFVANPADKRLFFGDYDFDKNNPEESYFSHIYLFIKYSGGPLRRTEYEKTMKDIPRANFTNSEGSFCPCGSGIQFKDCCYDKETIKIPHYNFFYHR